MISNSNFGSSVKHKNQYLLRHVKRNQNCWFSKKLSVVLAASTGNRLLVIKSSWNKLLRKSFLCLACFFEGEPVKCRHAFPQFL